MFTRFHENRYRNLVWVFVFVISLVRATSVQAEPITVEAYREWIQETKLLLSNLRNGREEIVQDQLSTLADRWERIKEVSLTDSRTITLDHSFLVAQFRSVPPDLDKLDALLTAIEETWETWPSPRHTSADLSGLKQILAQPEFDWQVSQPSSIQTWLEELPSRIIEFWMRNAPASILDLTEVINWVLLGLGIIVFLIILIISIRGVYTSFAPYVAFKDEIERDKRPASAEEALKKAKALSELGDYRSAVRYLYLSSLILLEERGVIHFDLTKTNREYLHTFAHRPELVEILRDVIDVFDRVWYGYKRIDANAYARYLDHVENLKQVT